MQDARDERVQKLSDRISLEQKGPVETTGRRMSLAVHNRYGVRSTQARGRFRGAPGNSEVAVPVCSGLSPAHFFPSAYH